MRVLENIVESITGVMRFGMVLWFVGIMLFGVLATGLSYSMGGWGSSPEILEARAEMQQQKIDAEIAKDQRRVEREMAKDGWGTQQPTATNPASQSRLDERERAFNELKEQHERREAGWGS